MQRSESEQPFPQQNNSSSRFVVLAPTVRLYSVALGSLRKAMFDLLAYTGASCRVEGVLTNPKRRARITRPLGLCSGLKSPIKSFVVL